MSKSATQRIFSILLLTGLLLGMVQPVEANRSSYGQQNTRQTTAQNLFSPGRAQVTYSIKNDVSTALRDLQPRQPTPGKTALQRELSLGRLPARNGGNPAKPPASVADPVVQTSPGKQNMPAPTVNIEGLNSDDNGAIIGGYLAPPDTSGAVGYDPVTQKKYYVQWVNLVFAIWDVTGTPTKIYGPAAGNSLWAGFGGICESSNDGDIIVLFDELSNRWFMSQFALLGPDGNHQCMAVSTGADPTGTWYRYDFMVSATKVNDYPKFGIWPNAFYMTANQFDNNFSQWEGAGVWAFERDQMLLGEPARMVYFDLFGVDPNVGGLLPADLDGAAPPLGAPGYFLNFDDDAWGYTTQDQLRLWSLSVDWTNPTNATFSLLKTLPTAPFDSQLCSDPRGACIDQPNGIFLEDLADRLMFRLQYRNFGNHQDLVVNHTVDVSNSAGSGHAGVRWYQLRDSGSGWDIYQQGSYAPDGDHRWMGSAAMDGAGNIAIGYSVSSSTTFPSISYAGRLAGDPLNSLPQAEVELAAGSASQDGTNRWGDYSEMTIDPTDNCTFWYTQEYVSGPNAIGWGNWFTRVGAFKFPTCTAGPTGVLNGTVKEAGTNTPVLNALVDLGNGITTFTDSTGFYQVLSLPVGIYNVSVSSYGYLSQTASNVAISEGVTTTQDFTLNPAPPSIIQGAVTDSAHGWPLYARIDITTFGHSQTVFTNPVDGKYSVVLLQDTSYTFKVHAISPGYLDQSRPVTPPVGGATEDFVMLADALTCNAPGYAPQTIYSADFEQNDGGFTVTGTNPSWQWGAPTSGPNNAHSGQNVWATNLSGDYNLSENSQIDSPAIDTSAAVGRTLIVSWWQWAKTEQDFDYISVDISKDGGASWVTYFGPVSGDINSQWTQYTVYLDPSYAVSDLRLRFHLGSDPSVTFPGFYVDDVTVAAEAPPVYGYNQDFEANDGGYSVSGETSWEWGTPSRGPSGAHSGTQAWATNLLGNYDNNEDGSITSPNIDLSAYAGNSMDLSWWQWLQTEAGYDSAGVQISKDGGATWDNVYTFSGIVDIQWTQYWFTLDPSYMVSNFQVRFYLKSDSTVTYPGFYVDDVAVTVPRSGPPLPPCEALPGGLAVGNVFDANNGSGVNLAVITSETGAKAVSFATPDDASLADGFYTLFTASGAQTLTATKRGGYGPDAEPVTVTANGVTLQNFHLPAGLLAADPKGLEATLTLGGVASTTLTLTNQGGLPADFKIKERDRGRVLSGITGAPVMRQRGVFTPYRLGAQPEPDGMVEQPASIKSPPWVDIANYPEAIMDNAAAEFEGLIYSVGGFNGGGNTNAAYVYDPGANTWSPIASMSDIREKPTAAFVNGLLYVVGGWGSTGSPDSNLEIYNPATNTWSMGAPVPTGYAASTAVGMDGKLYVIGGCNSGSCGFTDVFRYDPGTNLWESLAPYPEPASWNACGAISGLIYCAGGVSDAGGESSHTYVYDPTANAWSPLANMPQTQWGMGFTAANGMLYISGGVTNNFSTVTNQTFFYDPSTDTWSPDANSNHLVYRGGSACGFYKIGGSTGGFSPIPAAEVYPGLNACAAAADVPWLSESPITGTIAANGFSQAIDITFDASVPEVDQPGDYLAELNVTNNTPYKMDTIPVTMTVNPPATWGKLSGTITGLERCDQPGGPLTNASVEIVGKTNVKSGAGGVYAYWLEQGSYTLVVSAAGYVSQTAPVTVTAAGVTSQNFDLRLDQPCASTQPQGIHVKMATDNTTTIKLTLKDLGAADLSYNILESPFNLAPMLAPVLPAGKADFKLPDRTGPASLQKQDKPARLVEKPLLAPDTGWFGGLSLPGGILRYAHAQCYEQPNSFYVISGVDQTFSLTGNTWRYDAASNNWTKLAAIPQGQEAPTAVCSMGRIYVMGGGGTDQFYIYDIATNTWLAGAPLPRGVAGAAGGAWGGKIFLIGGDDDFSPFTGVSDRVDVYDIATDTWVGTGASLPEGTSFPGFVQVGPTVYVVGGWGNSAPTMDVAKTQRYDMSADAWVTGPDFPSARADFALAATSQALYAIGGDKDGGSFFDATNLVERLDLAAWPAGTWTDTGDPLPINVSANNAGFCAITLGGTAMWSVGGGDLNNNAVYGSTLFHSLPGETCYSIYADVPWLSVLPVNGVLQADSQGQITVTVNSAGLADGVYYATLVIQTNDPGAPLILVPVTLTVGQIRYYAPLVMK